MTTPAGDEAATLHERVAALEPSLSPSERAVARYLSEHPEIAATASALELGEQTRSSNATVVRTVKSLGYSSLNELKNELLRAMVDRLNPSSVLTRQLDQLETDGTVGRQVILASADLLRRQAEFLDASAWSAAVDILDQAAAVLCYGVEQAGSVAYYLSLQLNRSGKPSRVLTDTGISIANGLMGLAAGEAVVIIAPLRYFREVDAVLARAREVGAPTIVITEALRLSLQGRVDVILQTPESTFGTASEITAPLVLARGLPLEIAARHHDTALARHNLLNKLRASAAGDNLDVDRAVRRRGDGQRAGEPR
jgi:DNA-binding MurR/RpiR family transcriptional regulator